MIILTAFAGFAEGIGVLTLIPVLELAEGGGGSESSLAETINNLVRAVHLEPTLAVLLGVVLITILIKAGVLFLARRQIGFTVAAVIRDLRIQLMQKLFQVRWSYFGLRTPGEFAASITSEAGRASLAYLEACQLVSLAFQMAAYLAVAVLVSWWISVGGVLMAICAGALAHRYFRQSREAGKTQTSAARTLSSRLVDVLQGIKPIKAMAREGLVWPLLEHETERINQAMRRQITAGETVKAFQEPIVTFFLAIGLFLLVEVAQQDFTATLVMAFIFYRLAASIGSLQVHYQAMLVGESAFLSIQGEIESASREREISPGSRPFDGLKDGIHLSDVSFGYGDDHVLTSVSGFIPAGSFVAIHGESGSGKTTLADLIVGLHQPWEGEVLVDGVPLTELDLGSWRRSIGYVPQEMLLLADSIFENVTLGDPQFSRKDAEEALRSAGAWEFVRQREGGIDHPIGQAGSMLSGGQRQRVALARALVGKPSLLILDEVTTALDPETEAAICATLRELAGQVTILSISHQEAMREVADQVLVMREGRLDMAAAAHR